MSQAPSVPEPAPDSTTESTLGFKTRLLVVDDEPVILETMTAILEQEGFTVRTAEDGFAALNLLRQSQPDLIISDLRMPNMSGFELLSIVRRRYPHIPIIAISGEYVLEGMPPGLLMDAFFQKGGVHASSVARLHPEIR